MKARIKVDDDWIYVLILLLTGLLIAFACLTLSSAREYSSTQDCIIRTQELIATTREVSSLVSDIDASSHDYDFSPSPSTLTRIHSARTRLSATIAELGRLSGERPELRDRVQRLADQVNELLISLKSKEPETATREQVDRIRLLVEEIEAADNRSLGKRLHAQADAVQGVFTVMAVVGGLVPLVVAFLLLLWHASRRRRLKAEAELAEAKDRAESASTLKSQFVANTSHEIRTPMNAIIGLAKILEQTELSSHQREIVSRINGSATALLTIINDILDFSKIEAGKLDLESVKFSAADCVQRAAEMFKEQCAARDITMTVEIAEDVPAWVIGDPNRVHQVLVNLISNAIKFSENKPICVRLKAATNGETAKLRLEVEDHGIGMTKEELDKLFTPFVQADGSITRRFGGTGLGLSICKALAELMSGDIDVSSEKGQGSLFVFEFPATVTDDAPEPVVVSSQGFLPITAKLQGNVLIAEDNPNNQYVAELFLAQLGLGCKIVNNGKEAVEAYQSGSFDMILMDCQMPVLDGLAATRMIRDIERAAGNGDHIPIVALTASAMAQDRDACFISGMDDHLTKPLDQHLLSATLRKWLTALGSKSSGERAPINMGLLANRYADQASTVLKMFFEKTPPHLESLVKAIDEENGADARRLAHFLKGSSATICSPELTALLVKLEAQCAALDWDEARQTRTKVLECCKRIEDAAQTICPGVALSEVQINAR
jgi:signal transduction histidine kinase/DNA-binding NarL/FixJ family response regulator